MPCRPCAPRYTAEDWEHVFDHYAWKTNVFGNNVFYALGFQLLGHTPRTIFNMHRGTESLVWNAEDLVIVKVIVRYDMRVQQGEACSRNFQPQCRLLPKELQGRHVEAPVYEKIAASRWHDCAHTPWFLHMDYDKVKNLTPLSCCFPWAPQPTNVKARAAAFTACLDHSRGGSPSSLAPTPTVVPSMEQETPTLRPLSLSCRWRSASRSRQAQLRFCPCQNQLRRRSLTLTWTRSRKKFRPSDNMQEDDDGLQQQLQRAEHLTMTLERVNVRDSDSELSGISDEDDEEEPDDKMSQKDEDQDEHPKMSGGGCRLSQVDGKEHNCCDWRGSGRTPGSQSSALRQAIGSTHKLQQRRWPMSLRQASMTTCLSRMVELRRGYPGLDSRRRGRA